MKKNNEAKNTNELIAEIMRAYDRDHLTEEMLDRAIRRAEKEGQAVDWSRF